jgi:CHAT domain-containing protein
MMRRHMISVMGIAALLASGSALGATASAPGLPLGQNLAGEACRTDGAPSAAQAVDILCGTGMARAGKLQIAGLGQALPAEAGARRDAVLARAKTVAGGIAIGEQLICDGGQFLGDAGGSDSVLFLCTIQSNSWPRILVVSGAGRALYQAEGLPGMLPALQSAIAQASGRQIAMAETDAGERLLSMRVPATVLRAGTADFSDYTQSIELARLAGGANNFAGAEAAYRSAADVETRLFGPNSVPVGLALNELALQVSNQGRFDEAAQLFQRATPIIQASPNPGARARLNSYLALDAANQRDFAKALGFAREATAARRAELDSANGTNGGIASLTGQATMSSGELAHSLRIEAEMALKLDDLAGAQAAAEEALWIISLEPGLPLWWRADVLFLMGQVNDRQGRVGTAERDYLDGLALDQKLFGDSAPVALAELRIGRFYSDQQLYPQSLPHFRAALAILAKDPIARAQIQPDQIVPFIAAAAATTDPQQRAALDTEVFRASQFVNSDVADQTIARASLRVVAGNPMLADLIRQAQEASRARDNARINLAAEFAKSNEERDNAREVQLQGNLTAASARADELNARVQQTFPDYAKLSNPGPAELADARAQLQPGEAFLSFVVGVNGSYGLLVTQRGLTVKRIATNAEMLAGDIADLRRAFVPQLGGLPAFSLRNSYTLYTQVLGPFAADLNGVDHLIVAPGAQLENLPFGLLVTADPGTGANYGAAAWLIRRTALSQVPSPRAFLSLRQAEKARVAAPRPFLGIGDPTFTGAATAGTQAGTNAISALATGCREAGPVAPQTLRALPPLHDTAEEVNAVSRVLGGGNGSVLLGADASEANFRSQPLDQFGVLYFATHGLLPGELHCQGEPGLVLSPPAMQATTTDTDGLLDASEVAALKLNADLVVLSACNTAAAGGRSFGGGALEGLADAFFNAGARAVLASHWEVPSAATTQLMTGLFQRYGQNRMRGIAEALRQSQLALVATPGTAHPFNWAAFTLIGNSGALGATAAEPQRPVRQAANGGRP